MTETSAPPIPGHTITFAMPMGMTTRQVNRLIRDTTDSVIARQVKTAAPYSMLRHATANYDRREARSYQRGSRIPAHYVHGFGTPQRDTLVARYTPTLREVVVHFPPNYTPALAANDDWLQTRVYIWDAVIFAIGGPDGVGGVTVALT